MAAPVFAALVISQSCTKNEMEPQPVVPAGGDKVNFTAMTEPASKTVLNNEDHTVSWAAGDALKFVWDQEGTSSSAVSDPLAEGDIKDGVATFSVAVPAGYALHAVYPSSVEASYDGGLKLTVPAVQDGTFASAGIAVAQKAAGADNVLEFKNLCGLLKITVADENARKIEISSDNDLAGEVTVTFKSGLPVAAVVAGEKKITVNVPGPGTYYVSALPSEIANLYVSVKDASDNLLGDKISGNSFNVARKSIWNFGTIGTGFEGRYFVKVDGTGDGSGSNWDNAASYSTFQTAGKGMQKTVYMAAGTYNGEVNISDAATNVKVYGGFPADAAGYSLSGRDVVNNATVFDGGGTKRGWVATKGTYLLDGITFQNCYNAANAGSALILAGATVKATVNNCVLKNNENSGESKYGGAVRLNLGDYTFNDCTFNENKAASSGGALYMTGNGTKVKLYGCEFNANSVTKGNGGAIYSNMTNSSTLLIDNCKFTENVDNISASGTGGGAISVAIAADATKNTTPYEIKNTMFKGNYSKKDGGAIYHKNCDLVLTDCSFEANYITDKGKDETTFSGGGAIFSASAIESDLFLNRCYFSYNKMYKNNAALESNTYKCGHHIAVNSTTTNLGLNNCVISAPREITANPIGISTGSLITSKGPVAIVNTTIFSNTGNAQISMGSTDENGSSFINCIIVNSMAGGYTFSNADETRYQNVYYSLTSPISTNKTNISLNSSTTDWAYGDFGWVELELGDKFNCNDIRESFRVFAWNGTVEGKTIAYPTLAQVKEALNATVNVGPAFYAWLGDAELSKDVRGRARDIDAMWPGSYQEGSPSVGGSGNEGYLIQ